MSKQMLGVMIDCSRDAVYNVKTLKEYFEILSAMGYNTVQLYTEDVYEIESEPYFGYLRGRYSKQELKELDKFANDCGIELIPCIQTLAHLGGITRWTTYKGINDFGDILLADEDKTYELIEKMFKSCSECFTSKRINIGMDEAHMLGLGKYLDKHGFENRFDIILKHLNRVCDIAYKYGFKPMIWSDMFFRLLNKGQYYEGDGEIPKEVISLVPEKLELVYWDYYHTKKEDYDKNIKSHLQFNNKIIFAGGAWSWCGFAPNNKFSLATSKPALESCRELGIKDILITGWKDDGGESSLFCTLPSLFAISEYSKGNFDSNSIAKKFKKLFNIDFSTFMSLDDINLLKDDKVVLNPCKYMLYNDLFFGMFDITVTEEDAKKFSIVKLDIKKGINNKPFGYIFKTLYALCEVLEIKYELGKRTRFAYRNKDLEALKNLVKDYSETEKRLKKFYKLFELQWQKECKENGFEKHVIRIGGLIERVRYCKKQILAYCNGNRDNLDFLNEEILPINDMDAGKIISCNDWLNTAFIKPLS